MYCHHSKYICIFALSWNTAIFQTHIYCAHVYDTHRTLPRNGSTHLICMTHTETLPRNGCERIITHDKHGIVPKNSHVHMSITNLDHCLKMAMCISHGILPENGQSTEDGTVLSVCSRCFEPSQLHRITTGLNTNFTLSPSYSFHESSYHKSCFLSLFMFRGHSTREPASSRVTYFILRAYTGTMCKPQPTQ